MRALGKSSRAKTRSINNTQTVALRVLCSTFVGHCSPLDLPLVFKTSIFHDRYLLIPTPSPFQFLQGQRGFKSRFGLEPEMGLTDALESLANHLTS